MGYVGFYQELGKAWGGSGFQGDAFAPAMPMQPTLYNAILVTYFSLSLSLSLAHTHTLILIPL